MHHDEPLRVLVQALRLLGDAFDGVVPLGKSRDVGDQLKDRRGRRLDMLRGLSVKSLHRTPRSLATLANARRAESGSAVYAAMLFRWIPSSPSSRASVARVPPLPHFVARPWVPLDTWSRGSVLAAARTLSASEPTGIALAATSQRG